MADATSAAPSEREQFERHAKDRGYRLDRSTGAAISMDRRPLRGARGKLHAPGPRHRL